MLKFLLFIALFFIVIYYVLILPFKPRNQVNDSRSQRKRTRSGNVNIDHAPNERQSKSRYDDDGDYIDYEEVKD